MQTKQVSQDCKSNLHRVQEAAYSTVFEQVLKERSHDMAAHSYTRPVPERAIGRAVSKSPRFKLGRTDHFRLHRFPPLFLAKVITEIVKSRSVAEAELPVSMKVDQVGHPGFLRRSKIRFRKRTDDSEMDY